MSPSSHVAKVGGLSATAKPQLKVKGIRKAPAKAATRKAAVKAQPLKFFNVRTSERFVFRRRDKRCLTLPSRASLVPVFILFSDIFPDVVQTTLANCRKLIQKCPRVIILKPTGPGQRDEVIWDGSGTVMPGRCWDRQGCLLRTLDIVHYKASAPDRKRELLPIERDLWSVLEPFLGRIRACAEELIEGNVELAEMQSQDAMQAAMQSDKPWSLRIDAVLTDVAPTVGDRDHELYYSPKAGLFTRRIADDDKSADGQGSIPLVTLPCRLNSAMSTHPPLCRILEYLSSVSARINSAAVRAAVLDLASRHPVPEDGGLSEGPAGGVEAREVALKAVEHPVMVEDEDSPRGCSGGEQGMCE